MDIQIGGLDDLKERFDEAMETIVEYQLGTRVDSDEFFSEPFMEDHTEFDSFRAFCDESPWTLDTPEDIQSVPSSELDGYVSKTTDFETWEEMKTTAAEEAIVFDLLS